MPTFFQLARDTTMLACLYLALVLGVARADDMPTLPAAKTQNGVSYLSGGVGEDQADLMKAAASAYSLMLTFAGHSGAYLAEVKVTISDARGHTVLNTVSDGPILLVKLAPGSYRVMAEYQGQTQTQNLTVKDIATTRATLQWNT